MFPFISLLTGLKAAEPSTSARLQLAPIGPGEDNEGKSECTEECKQALRGLQELGRRDLVLRTDRHIDEALLERIEEGAAWRNRSRHFCLLNCSTR